MSAKKMQPETLEEALKDLMRHVRDINKLEHLIDEKWGVRMIAGTIPAIIDKTSADITVRRGIEEIEKVLGKEAKDDHYFRHVKELRYYGVTFIQYADDRTKTFVKAGCQPPKVQIVEDDGNA